MKDAKPSNKLANINQPERIDHQLVEGKESAKNLDRIRNSELQNNTKKEMDQRNELDGFPTPSPLNFETREKAKKA